MSSLEFFGESGCAQNIQKETNDIAHKSRGKLTDKIKPGGYNTEFYVIKVNLSDKFICPYYSTIKKQLNIFLWINLFFK